ncbi:MAG: replication-associated recombination protein A [Bacilli bacterium]
MQKPLAALLRPKNIDEIIGQSHLVGPDGFLHRSIETNTLFSFIFYGPPGCGKTTLAEAYAKSLKIKYIKLNAVTNNKKDLEAALLECSMFENAIIIMDEVHRLNKDKQDILLPYIEEGTIYLIGCTTQNPYISINKAIRSRCQLLEVKPLSFEDIKKGIKNALSSKNGLKNEYQIDEESIDYIARNSNGDLRFALNYLQALSMAKNKTICIEDTKKVLKVPNYKYDKNEDDHYDSVSALQKSIRGSDVDAALFYLAKLCVYEDLDSIKRRLTVIAYEDVGLGNPQAVDRVHNAIEAAEQLGFPEAIIPLGFAVCELALSPKSRSSCDAIENAYEFVKNNPYDVLSYLKYTPVNVDEEDKYPYDRPDLWNKIQYLPELIKDKKFFKVNKNPSSYEKGLIDNYNKLSSIKRSSNLRKLKNN